MKAITTIRKFLLAAGALLALVALYKWTQLYLHGNQNQNFNWAFGLTVVSLGAFFNSWNLPRVLAKAAANKNPENETEQTVSSARSNRSESEQEK